MTSQTSGTPNQPWQPPSEESQEPQQPPRYGAYGEARAQPPGSGSAPQEPDPGAAGQYAGRAAAYGAFGATGPGQRGAFFLAPKPGIVPLRPLSITEIIGGAFEALRANPRAMFLPSLVIMSVIGLISGALTYMSSHTQYDTMQALSASQDPSPDEIFSALQLTGSAGAAQLIDFLLLALATTILTGLLIVAVSRSVLGRIATPGAVWQRVRSRIWPLIGQSLLIELITAVMSLASLAIGFVILFALFSSSSNNPSLATIIFGLLAVLILVAIIMIASCFFAVRLYLAAAALILENVSVWEGIRRSWHLTKGSFWRVIGILVLTTLITLVLLGAIMSAMSIASQLAMSAGAGMYATVSAVTAFATSLLQAAILPFSSAVNALTYIDLRMRTEGLDVELRQAAKV